MLWRRRGIGRAGARSDCSNTLLMRIGLAVKVISEQRPEEGRKPFMLISGRAVQTKECGWRGVSNRKGKGSSQRENSVSQDVWSLKVCVRSFILVELENHGGMN